jgi:DNA-binding transcriptional LysR family regulator
LLRYCQAVQEIEGEALAKIKGTGLEADIHVSITGATSIMRSRVIPQCIPVIKKFPKLHIRFDINDIENRVKSIQSGENQLAIIQECDKLNEMKFKALKPESYVLVCSSAWKKEN